MKMPAMQFYPGDWKKDLGVQSLSLEERGFWFELLLLMFESEDRGKLILNGQPMTDTQIANATGLDKQKATTMLTTLLTSGVASREPQTGALFCRRMVRDENLRQIRAEAGKMGGNPILLKQNLTTHVKQNPTPSSSVSSSVSFSEEENTHVHGKRALVVVDPRDAWFDEFWVVYGKIRNANKAKAKVSFRRVVSNQTAFDRIMDRLRLQAPGYLAREPDKRPHATTWLNGARWEDEPDAPPGAVNGSLFADSKTVRAMEIYMARKEAEEAYEADAD